MIINRHIGRCVRMKSLVLALFVYLGVEVVNSQTPQLQWALQPIGEGWTDIHTMATDSEGNTLIAIYHNTPFSFAGSQIPLFTLLTSAGAGSTLIKLDPDGNILWYRSLRGPLQNGVYVTDIDTDEDNNIFVVYVGTSTVENASPIGSLYASSSRPNDKFLVKISPEGEGIWFRTANASTPVSVVNLLTTVGADGVYSTGTFEGNVNFSGTPNVNLGLNTNYIVKHDLNGNFIWIKTLANTFGTINLTAMQAASDGSLYLAGNWNEDALHIDHLSIENDLAFTGNHDRWICKIGPDGIAEWIKREHSSGFDSAPALAITPAGDLLVLSTKGLPALTVGDILLNEGPGMVLSRYSATGEVMEATYVCNLSTIQPAISSYGNGGYYVVGSFTHASYNFGGIEVLNSGGTTGTQDGFLAKMNENGIAEWVYTVGGPDNENIRRVKAAAAGQVAIAGTYNGENLNIQGSILLNTAEFVSRHFLASFNTVLSARSAEALQQLIAYPNPFTENVQFDAEALQAFGNATLVVFNTSGAEVYRKQLQGNDLGQLNLAHLPKGTYIARLSDGKHSLHTKIVKL